MRRVFFRRVAAALLVLVLATPAIADGAAADPGLWPQFLTWINGRIGIPNGDPVSFEEWVIAMGRIGIPNG